MKTSSSLARLNRIHRDLKLRKDSLNLELRWRKTDNSIKWWNFGVISTFTHLRIVRDPINCNGESICTTSKVQKHEFRNWRVLCGENSKQAITLGQDIQWMKPFIRRGGWVECLKYLGCHYCSLATLDITFE